SGNENVQARQAEKEISVSIPAATTGILSVGALQAGDDGFEIADFSNTLPQIAAPGVNVVSAQSGGGLVSLDGTSMATPHVAGIAALFWQQLRSAGRNTDSQLVLSRILTGATFSGLSPDTDEADVGVGLARAPGLSFV
ncbi:MAG: S8 family serine peptidase, partial [Bacteroidota bacterium]